MPQLAYPNSNLSLTRPQASFRPVKPLGPSAPSSGPAGPDRHHPSDSATSAGPTHRRAAAPHAAATLPGRLSGLPWRVSRAARSAHSRPSGGGSGPQPGRVSRGSTALSPSPAPVAIRTASRGHALLPAAATRRPHPPPLLAAGARRGLPPDMFADMAAAGSGPARLRDAAVGGPTLTAPSPRS